MLSYHSRILPTSYGQLPPRNLGDAEPAATQWRSEKPAFLEHKKQGYPVDVPFNI